MDFALYDSYSNRSALPADPVNCLDFILRKARVLDCLNVIKDLGRL